MDGTVCAAAWRVVRGGPGGVHDGSLVSFAGIASADGSDRDGPGVLPDSSLVSLAGIASATAKRLA